MATAPSFAATPASSSVVVSTANTGRDGTGTIGVVFTSPATRSVADGVTTSGSINVTSATAAFTERDRGKGFYGAGIPTGTTIVAVLSATSILLSAAATATATGVTIAVIGGGSRIDEVTVKGTGTLAAGCVPLYISDGTNHRVYDEITVGLVTASTTSSSGQYRAVYNNLFLPAGYSLRASTTIAQSLTVTANGGDF